MTRPTMARAELAPLETAPPVPTGGEVPDEEDGPTGVLDPEAEVTAVPLL